MGCGNCMAMFFGYLELSNIAKGGVGAGMENGYIDLYSDTPITLYVKAMPPSKVFPKVI